MKIFYKNEAEVLYFGNKKDIIPFGYKIKELNLVISSDYIPNYKTEKIDLFRIEQIKGKKNQHIASYTVSSIYEENKTHIYYRIESEIDGEYSTYAECTPWFDSEELQLVLYLLKNYNDSSIPLNYSADDIYKGCGFSVIDKNIRVIVDIAHIFYLLKTGRKEEIDKDKLKTIVLLMPYLNKVFKNNVRYEYSLFCKYLASII